MLSSCHVSLHGFVLKILYALLLSVCMSVMSISCDGVLFPSHLHFLFIILLYIRQWYCWCIVMDSWILFVSVDMEWCKKFRHFSSDRVWHWSRASWATQSNQNSIPVALWQSHQNHCAFTLLAVVTYSRYGVLTVIKLIAVKTIIFVEWDVTVLLLHTGTYNSGFQNYPIWCAAVMRSCCEINHRIKVYCEEWPVH